METRERIPGTAIDAEYTDLVVYDINDKFMFAESNCKTLKQLREIVLNDKYLHNISYCKYKGKRYTMPKIYAL
jgi:hypothetical protein